MILQFTNILIMLDVSDILLRKTTSIILIKFVQKY
mgnify:CR=1 FL=1